MERRNLTPIVAENKPRSVHLQKNPTNTREDREGNPLPEKKREKHRSHTNTNHEIKMRKRVVGEEAEFGTVVVAFSVTGMTSSSQTVTTTR